jgi:SNF2 family DNA or RNA helicase
MISSTKNRAKKSSRHVSKSRRISKKTKRAPYAVLNALGWNTTDSDEIERRRLRAQTEKLKIRTLEPEYGYFGSFLVSSKEQNTQYRTEIRSLSEYINSCECQDYRTNRLGTCKHIEHVLFRLQKKGRRKYKQSTIEGSPRVEVFMDRRIANAMRIAWPNNSSTALRALLEPFFKLDGTTRATFTVAYSKIRRAILSLKNSVQNKIRFSAHMEDIIEHQKFSEQTQKTKAIFLAELQQGKHNLNTLKFPLYPYQEEGMLHLALNRRALLADEMGLGKTVQAIAACHLLYRSQGVKKVLVIATASLKTEWEEQIAKFTTLKTLIIQGPRAKRLQQYEQDAFFYLTNYEQIVVDGPDIQRLLAPDVIILDEAQRIKNWQTKTANAIKQLQSPYAFILTGTPLENKIDDIYSLVQFLDPHLFGPLFLFNRYFYQLDAESGRPSGYKNLDALHQKLRPIMLRRRKGDVEDQLPERTINNYFVSMDKEQRLRYEEYEKKVANLAARARQRALRKEEYERLQQWLACMRMLCDTPYILDPKCRISPKIRELENTLEELLADHSVKILIFSEWERMLQLVRELAEKLEIKFAWHTGSVPQHKRRQEINRFKEDPQCRLFLSTDAGSLGLNLQAANIVINLDLPWNPAKLEQRIARAWRKNQPRTVRVINFVCQDSIEHRMLNLLSQKQNLAQGVLDGDDALKEMPLPSGRAAFIERMDSLINPPVDTLQLEPELPIVSESSSIVASRTEESEITQDQALENFKETINQWVAEIVSTRETTQDIPSDVTHLEAIDPVLQPAFDSAIEIIDPNTLDIIQRLVQAGVLSLGPNIKALPNREGLSESLKNIREKQLQQAKTSCAYAFRKQRLARVLIEQGFFEETITPLREALVAAIQAFFFLINDSKTPKITDRFVREELIAHYKFPEKTALLWTQLNKKMEENSDALIPDLLAGTEEAIQYVSEALDKATTLNIWPITTTLGVHRKELTII